MTEIFSNEVTVIFGLLALFFVLMGLGRHMIRRRHRRDGQSLNKPYDVSDPYAEPENAVFGQIPVGEENGATAAKSPSNPKRYFKEFTANTATTSTKESSQSGYAWE